MKVCQKCCEELDESQFRVYSFYSLKKDKKRILSYRTICKKCESQHTKEWKLKTGRYSERFKNKLAGKRKCKRCGEVLDLVNFRKSNNYFNKTEQKWVKNPYNCCIECEKLNRKDNWIANKDRLTSEEHKAEVRKRRKDKFFQYRALLFRRNYGCLNIKTIVIAKVLWHKWHHQKGLCAITGRKLTKENAQVDHIEPRLNGHANNNPENLRWVIADANKMKNQFPEEEFDKFIIDIYNFKKLELKNTY